MAIKTKPLILDGDLGEGEKFKGEESEDEGGTGIEGQADPKKQEEGDSEEEDLD